jgi:hypothetical protein
MISKAITNNLSPTMATNKIFFIFDKFLRHKNAFYSP